MYSLTEEIDERLVRDILWRENRKFPRAEGSKAVPVRHLINVYVGGSSPNTPAIHNNYIIELKCGEFQYQIL